MKNIEEIKRTTGIQIKMEGQDGFAGTVHKVIYKNGKPKFSNKCEDMLNFIFSWGGGFEHLSVSTPVRTPTWEQMCLMKDIFWRDDKICMELHPKKEEYVDNMPYCLHIWRPIDQEIPTPPSIMVGFRNGKEVEDLELLMKYADEMPKR